MRLAGFHFTYEYSWQLTESLHSHQHTEPRQVGGDGLHSTHGSKQYQDDGELHLDTNATDVPRDTS